MNYKIPSGSTADRGAACAASHAYPQAPEPAGEPAEKGKAGHAFIYHVANSPATRSEALAAVPEQWRGLCANIDIARLFDGFENIRTEVAFGYRAQSGAVRLLGINMGRPKGPRAEDEAVCVLDLVGKQRGTGRVMIQDHKFGKRVGDPEKAWQLRLGALCAARRDVEGTISEEVVVRFAYLDEEGRVDSIEEGCLTEMDLDMAADEWREILANIRRSAALIEAGKIPSVNPGDHCRYCAAVPYCHEKTALVRSMLPDMKDLAERVDALTLEQAGRAWTKAREVKALLERVESALKARASQEPLPLDNGKTLHMDERQGREYLDKEATLAVLRDLGADEGLIRSLVKKGKPYLFPQERRG